MAKINPYIGNLGSSYLFKNIGDKTREHIERTGVTPFKLGIGNTTEPLTPVIGGAMVQKARDLMTRAGYSGYGSETGETFMKDALAAQYGRQGIKVDPSEIFINDGAKPDTASIQNLFSSIDSVVAVQDPAYPVYVESNVIAGRATTFDPQTGQYDGLVYLESTPANGFFSLPNGKVDLLYICSPNNPTGAVATKAQLKQAVDYARENKAVIIFDAAYSAFIQDPSLPKSIYEIEGADECAIETNSFSKVAGFTGVRLGWTVVPKNLVVEDTKQGELNTAWDQRQNRHFNGPSNIAQAGGLAALTDEGLIECNGLVNGYMNNAQVIKSGLESIDLTVYNGDNAPFLWLETLPGLSSWDMFDKLLREANVVSTPGSGFGPSGEGFVRLSAFGSPDNIEAAVESITKNLKL